MKRLIVLLFVAGALATAFAPGAFANNGRDDNGDPGNGDSTARNQTESKNWGPNGQYFNACH